ncbi:hypothetical protein RA2_03896 [Roseovarius sp. A-2]|nr:hypothetical protein RA2_03896 [Roseovarius sp. A-2]
MPQCIFFRKLDFVQDDPSSLVVHLIGKASQSIQPYVIMLGGISFDKSDIFIPFRRL